MVNYQRIDELRARCLKSGVDHLIKTESIDNHKIFQNSSLPQCLSTSSWLITQNILFVEL